jgi:hypothetical protein
VVLRVPLVEERATATDVNGVVSANVKGRAPRDILNAGNVRPPVDKAGPPLLPVTIAVTLPPITPVREPLTVKLRSVNVDSGSAVTELLVTVKSLGIGTKVPTVPGVSVAA